MPLTPRAGLVLGPDPTKLYYAKRAVRDFERPEQSALAKRADGVLANAPADTFVTVSELTNPKFVRLLSPLERSVHQQTIDVLEWSGTVVPQVTVPPPVGFSVSETVLRSPVDRARPIPASELRGLADLWPRLQVLADSDGNPATVSLADLDAIAVHPDRDGLTARELELANDARRQIIEWQNKQAVAPRRVVEVGPLGRTATPLLPAASVVRLNVVSSAVLVTRNHELWPTLERYTSIDFQAPADCTVKFIDPQTGESFPYPRDGATFMEVWRQGRRIEQYSVTIPALPDPIVLPLRDYAGAEFTTNGELLGRRDIEWGVGGEAPHWWLDGWRDPDPFRRHVGLFEDGAGSSVEILRSGVIRAEVGGQSYVFNRSARFGVDSLGRSVTGELLDHVDGFTLVIGGQEWRFAAGKRVA